MTSRGRTSFIQEANIKSFNVFLFTSLILLRVLVGFQPHSGQNNYHGSHVAYGGDYEAQRHWMELTLHLPIGEWYQYDLQYWGLDYPPLTAYVSYICGVASSLLVGPESVALNTSRGFEHPVHKAYMRGTVLFLDVLFYFTAVGTLAQRLHSNKQAEYWWTIVLGLAQPALILIDHGHFQYNTVALGLALWSFHFMTKNGGFKNCVYGSVLFCLALNFKQMTLYYAPAVFAYLLGRCFTPGPSITNSWITTVVRVSVLGGTVITTFAILWWPFVVQRLSGVTASDALLQIVTRLFPLQRGMFEGKVANIWCVLSTKPISIRERLPEDIQPLLALALTFILIMPACTKVFFVGKEFPMENEKIIEKKMKRTNISKRSHRLELLHLRTLLMGATSTALAFFLASFQVHEKSILMAVSPLSLLLSDVPLFVAWFTVISTWTLWHLLVMDRLVVAYFACIVVFVAIMEPYFVPIFASQKESNFSLDSLFSGGTFFSNILAPASIVVALTLHFTETVLQTPDNLPDIYPLLWSVVGCTMFLFSWLCSCWILWKIPLDRGMMRAKVD